MPLQSVFVVHVDNGLGGGHLTLNSVSGNAGRGQRSVDIGAQDGIGRAGVDSLTVDSGLGIALHLLRCSKYSTSAEFSVTLHDSKAFSHCMVRSGGPYYKSDTGSGWCNTMPQFGDVILQKVLSCDAGLTKGMCFSLH